MKKFITSLAVIATVGLSGCSVPTFTPNGWPGVSQQNASSPSPSPSPHEQVISFLAKRVNSAEQAHQAGFVYGAGVAIYCPKYGE